MAKTVSSIVVDRKDRRRIVVTVTVEMTTGRAVANRWIVPVPTATDRHVAPNVVRVRKAVSGGRSGGMTKDGVALVPARNGGIDRNVLVGRSRVMRMVPDRMQTVARGGMDRRPACVGGQCVAVLPSDVPPMVNGAVQVVSDVGPKMRDVVRGPMDLRVVAPVANGDVQAVQATVVRRRTPKQTFVSTPNLARILKASRPRSRNPQANLLRTRMRKNEPICRQARR